MKRAATVIVALDTSTAAAALGLVGDLGETCSFYKVGNELYTAEGPAIVRTLRDRGASVFLDLKLHDIPNTVSGAVRAAASHGARLVTVHASGGRELLRAAVASARDADPRCGILAVTVLTSLDSTHLAEAWGHRIQSVELEVLRLAEIAAEEGAHGIVCSGQEARSVRSRFGDRLAILVPGVRLAGGEHQDQARVVTPREAADAGASYIVLGRAVTTATHPRVVMQTVLADLS